MIDLDTIKREYNEILQQLSDPELISNWERMEELTKKKSWYEKIVSKQEELEEVHKKIEENKEILAIGETELISLAEEELKILKNREDVLQNDINVLFEEPNGEGSGALAIHPHAPPNTPREGAGIRSVIMEIRAGVGGEEAALFASNLFKMYSRYAQSRGWKQKILDSSQTELGGCKEIVFELSGEGVAKLMQYEGGVHRVQRIPETEKSGRVHTSTCSVAVLPKPSKAQIKIRPEDLRVDLYRASGPGGQNVNRRETAVRITHIPSGIVVTSQTERNQLLNKENAMSILEAKLLVSTKEKEEEELHGTRNIQIKQAKRAEKIRTYNFPQDRVTDHRIKKSWHNLEEIMDGMMGPVIEETQKNLKSEA